MHVHPLRSRKPFGTRMLSAVALTVICASCATAMASVTSSKLNLAGTWSGTYGGAFSGTFKLQWTQSRSKLTGSINLSNPAGKYGITGGVHGSSIKFGAVGVGATYTGRVSASGTKMSGKYQSPQGGGSWSAHKCNPRMVRC